jgi:hypothetical protein
MGRVLDLQPLDVVAYCQRHPSHRFVLSRLVSRNALVAALLHKSRQIDSCPETGFAEISSPQHIPRRGLLARNNFRFVRHSPTMNRKAERNVQFDARGLPAGLVTLIEVKT